MMSADSIAAEIVSAILQDLAPPAGSRCLLLVNGMGGTPAMELYLIVNATKKLLQDAGLRPVCFLTGAFVTSLETAGCSITVTLLDEELYPTVGCACAHRGVALGRVRPGQLASPGRTQNRARQALRHVLRCGDQRQLRHTLA